LHVFPTHVVSLYFISKPPQDHPEGRKDLIKSGLTSHDKSCKSNRKEQGDEYHIIFQTSIPKVYEAQDRSYSNKKGSNRGENDAWDHGTIAFIGMALVDCHLL
jgi:hypothetical protein